MEKKHRDILRRNQVAFIKDLIVDEVFLAHMQSQNIVTDIFKEEIEVEKVATKRSSKFMNYLPRRGKNAFDVFYEALRATDQESLADLLYTDCSSSTKPVLKRALSQGGKTVCAPSEDIPEEDDDLPEEFPDPSFSLEFSIKHISEKKKQKLDNMKDVYPISRPGRCVIINNEKFAKPKLNRYGTNMDATVLDTLFRKFGYQVITHNDKTAEEIKEIAEEESGLVKDHGDSFIFIILSHGKKDHVLGVDLNEVEIKFIVDQFDGNNCPALLRKPKMFFLQACQGEHKDKGVANDQGDTVDGGVDVSHKAAAAALTDKQVDDIFEEVQATMDKLCLTQVTQPEEVSDASSVPTKADTLVAMSTVPDYVSWRSESKGSWFIQAIVTVFSKCAHKDDLTSMMTKVNNLVSKAATGKNKFKQIPVTKNTLIRKVFFKPGMYDW